jgi:signal transduction histidine kinase/DNA-binding response OmpR family regulator
MTTRRTFRTRLLATALVAGSGLTVILASGAVVDRRVTREIDTIRTRFIPKIGLADQLQSSFERVSRRLHDAAEAAEIEMLDDAERQKTTLLDQLAAARAVIDPGESAAAREAVEDYYRAAESVARRMIRGETGDAIVRDAEAMQRKQVEASGLLARAGHFDEASLAAAFSSVVDAQASGTRDRLLVSVTSLLLVLGLSLWISRALYRGLADLATGFQRFGAGDFETPIRATSDDELGSVARDANQMAERLRRLANERDDSDWLKAGQVGLAEQLRGELDPDEVARRSLSFLARYLGVPLGVVYHADSERVLWPLAGYGVPVANATAFEIGEGIVGEAACRNDITVITAERGHLPIRSVIANGDPRSIVLVPLVHADRVTGVIELAVVSAWTDVQAELVLSVRDTIAIALEVARGRVEMRALLAETQRQAAELLAARRGIEQKAEELARASAYKSQFLANMSHELRTPLNAIIGFSELMVDGALPLDAPQTKEFLGDILTSGRHLLQLVNDVLDLSKVEAGKLDFSPAATRLSTVVNEVLAILRTAVAKKRVQLETAISEDIDEVTLDPARLKQVLYNYVSNALKFTPDGGHVTIRARPAEGDRLRLEVEDTGPGIAPDDLARLFVEFQQTREGTRQGTGTGLGLALTKRLVEAQGGSVGVSSAIGRGSLFHAVLPRVYSAPTTAGAAAPAPAPPRGEHVAPEGAPTILVIEDEASDRERLAAVLVGAGFAVETAETGAEAIERCTARSYDAITLDLLLPDMTGLEVLQRLRTSRNRNVPVVVITVVAERGAVAGFAVHDILPKPLEDRALLSSLERAGILAGASGRAVLVVDDDAASLKVMSATLAQLGYEAVCEQDASKGLERAVADRPSAIVLDLIMPGMSGFEFLDRLREVVAGRDIPVIVWTSKDLTSDERAALRRSAHAIVSKGHDGNARVVAELAALFPSGEAS